MTEAKLQEFLSNIGISISAGQVSNLLIKNGEIFETEKVEVYQAGLESSHAAALRSDSGSSSR